MLFLGICWQKLQVADQELSLLVVVEEMLLALGVVSLYGGFRRFCLCHCGGSLFDGKLFMHIGIEASIFQEVFAKHLNPS